MAMISLYVGIYRVALGLHRRSAAKRERSIACLVSMAGGTVTQIGSVIGMTRTAPTSSSSSAVAAATAAASHKTATANAESCCRLSNRQQRFGGCSGGGIGGSRTGYVGGIATIGLSEASNGGRPPTEATYRQLQANIKEPSATSSTNVLVGDGGQMVLDDSRQQCYLTSSSNGNATCSSLRHPDAVQSPSQEQARGGHDGAGRRRLHFAVDEADCFRRNHDDKHESPCQFSSAAFGSTLTKTIGSNTPSPKPENSCKFASSAGDGKPFDNGIPNSMHHAMATKPSLGEFNKTATSGQQQGIQPVLLPGVHVDSALNAGRATTSASGWFASCRFLDGDDELLVDVNDRKTSAAEMMTELGRPLLTRTSDHMTSGRISMKAAVAVSGRPEDLDELPYFDDDDDDDDVFAINNGICTSSTVTGRQLSAKTDDDSAGERRYEGDFTKRAEALGLLCSINSDGTAGDWTDGDIEMVPVAQWQSSRNDRLADDNEDDENNAGRTIDGSATADEGGNWNSPVQRRDARYAHNLLQPSMPSERQALLPLTCNLRIPGVNSIFVNVALPQLGLESQFLDI